MNYILSNNRGQILAGVIILLLIGLTTAITIATFTANRITVDGRDLHEKQAQNLADAGINYAINKINSDSSWTGVGETALGNGSFEVTTSAIGGGSKLITAIGYIPNKAHQIAKQTIRVRAGLGDGVSIFYAVQAGDQGASFGNTSKIFGNLYSNGNVIGGSGSEATGTVIVAGTSSLSALIVDQDAYAHTLQNCTIGGKAYYSTISNCTVSGQKFPGSSDQLPADFPISNDQITQWENDAAVGGIQSGISLGNGASLTIGPKKINGTLTAGNTFTMTITGTVYITGNLTLGNGATIKLGSSYGGLSGILIVGGKISTGNTTSFLGSGATGSSILIIGLSGTGDNDVNLSNGINGGVFFVPNGTLEAGNTIQANAIMARKIDTGNGAQISYQTGLASTNFSSGPSAGWSIQPGTWQLVK